MPRIRVFERGVAIDWYWEGLLCALVIYVCITHWLFLSTLLHYRFLLTLLPHRTSVTLACVLFSGKQAGRLWTWYTAPLKLGVSIPCSHRNAAGARQVALPSSCADTAGLPKCRGKEFKQIPASGLCCTKKGQGPEPTRLGFIRKVSHLVSKNSRGKGGETQLQARWEEAAVLPVC